LEDLPAKRANSQPKGQQAPRKRRESVSKGEATTRKRKKPAKPRPRDLIWDAVADTWFKGRVPPSRKTAAGRVVVDLKAMEATPEQIVERTERLRRLAKKRDWGPVSMHALVKWWNELENEDAPKDRPGRIEAPPGKYANLRIVDA
jgi:hypothetical protein